MQAEESEVLRSEAAAFFQNEKANTEENDVVREEAAAKEGCPLHRPDNDDNDLDDDDDEDEDDEDDENI